MFYLEAALHAVEATVSYMKSNLYRCGWLCARVGCELYNFQQSISDRLFAV